MIAVSSGVSWPSSLLARISMISAGPFVSEMEASRDIREAAESLRQEATTWHFLRELLDFFASGKSLYSYCSSCRIILSSLLPNMDDGTPTRPLRRSFGLRMCS